MLGLTAAGLMFNPHKCKYMVISRKKTNLLVPPLITLGSSAIERTHSYKYLGVSISSDLSWSEHIYNICTRARRTIGLLYCHFYLNSNSTSLQKLYLTLVQPLLEYGCQVWHPHLVRDIAKLERVQKLVLRLCTKQWTLDYSTLLSLCNLPSLETRRKYFCLCTMYKIVNKLIDFPPDIFVQRVTPFHSASDQLFNQPFSHTNAFMYSYVHGSCHI